MDQEFNQEDEDAYFAYLLEIGAIEIDGVNENGDLLFRPNSEKMKEYAPEMYEMMMQDINDNLMELYKKGLVKMEYNDNLEPMFDISELGEKALQEMGFYPLDEPDNK